MIKTKFLYLPALAFLANLSFSSEGGALHCPSYINEDNVQKLRDKKGEGILKISGIFLRIASYIPPSVPSTSLSDPIETTSPHPSSIQCLYKSPSMGLPVTGYVHIFAYPRGGYEKLKQEREAEKQHDLHRQPVGDESPSH